MSRKELRYEPTNYYGFDHSFVNKRFEGDLTYLGDIILKDQDRPWAVYKAAKPNAQKGHKKYMLLSMNYCSSVPNIELGALTSKHRIAVVQGMTPREMSKHRSLAGVWCKTCDKVLVSLSTHDFVQCECLNRAFADGGSRYLRIGAQDLSRTKIVEVDALTGEVKLGRQEQSRVRKLQKTKTPRKTKRRRRAD